MINKCIVSASMMIVASQAVAAAKPGSIDIGKLDLSNQELSDKVDAALSKKNVNEVVNLMFSDLALSMSEDGITLQDKFWDKGINVAATDANSRDSTDAYGVPGIGCYANCYTNCHSACHGNRGWR